jgi:hypothetical protein
LLLRPHVIFKSPIGCIERFPDGNREIFSSLAVDRDLGARKGEVDADPDAAAQGMLPRAVDGNPAFLDPAVEVSQFLGPLLNVLRELSRQQSGARVQPTARNALAAALIAG